jgi:hypothetical protein
MKEQYMTSKRSFGIVPSVLGVLLIAGLASAQDVNYNAMPGTNFAAFKTYKWVPIEGGVKVDQIVEAQITQAIDAELAKKGLTKSADDKADLYVGYQAAVNQERQWNAYGGGIGFRGMGTATSSTIAIGTLGVDIYDQAGKQLVWRGSATKTLDPGAKPEKRQENITKAVDKLLKNFPPPAKK